ncbi:hypothetical protein HS088_TW12G00347 [Tripterygium wilfordii]|uniref:Uncharacterized protein n=1 Tax=Tripterygium wilfordii TaxID=458696 RepID=A0A7J7CYG6_TRIWF|nr:hypothetical protein HS088_TW12G00347 [Tripterygium wilfordii]
MGGDPYVGRHWQHNVPHPTENKPMPTPLGFPFIPQKSQSMDVQNTIRTGLRFLEFPVLALYFKTYII